MVPEQVVHRFPDDSINFMALKNGNFPPTQYQLLHYENSLKRNKKMEETKLPLTNPRRKTSKRKPLIDLSNTFPSSLPSSQSSSSSLIKTPTRSSLSLTLQSLSSNPNSRLSSKSKLTSTESIVNNNNENDKKKKKKDKEKCQSNKANPSSTLSSPPQTPSVSVYNRRHTAEKRKSKGKEIAEPLSRFSETRMQDLRKKKDGDSDIDISKSCPLPRKKKQHRAKAEANASKHELPQEFIDKQRAYFAAIDAFELEEEEASTDELE